MFVFLYILSYLGTLWISKKSIEEAERKLARATHKSHIKDREGGRERARERERERERD
jgi:uncharacterized membrane protein YqjE